MKKTKKYLAKEGVKVKQNQSYEDSALLSNEAAKFDRLAKSGKYNYQQLNKIRDEQVPTVLPAYKRLMQLNGDSPIPSRTFDNPVEGGDIISQRYQYPKGKKKDIKKININSLDPNGIKMIDEDVQDITMLRDAPDVDLPPVKNDEGRRESYQYITMKRLKKGGNIKSKTENDDTIKETTKRKSYLQKTLDVLKHPMSAMNYIINGKEIPDHFYLGDKNIYDYATEAVNPLSYIDPAKRILTGRGTTEDAMSFILGPEMEEFHPSGRNHGEYSAINSNIRANNPMENTITSSTGLGKLQHESYRSGQVQNKDEFLFNYRKKVPGITGVSEIQKNKNGGEIKNKKIKYVVGGKVEIPGKSVFDPNEGKSPIPQAPQMPQNNFGTGPYSTPNNAPQPINPAEPTTDNRSNQNGFNIDFKNPLQAKNWNPEGGFNVPDGIAAGIAGISGLLPYQKPHDNQKKLVDAYNPYGSSGTGSHSTFRKGGYIKGKKKAESGVDMTITDSDRDAWEALQSKAYQQGFKGDNHNPQIGANFAQQNGFDPKRISAIQQDFQNQQGTPGVRAGSEGFSPVDNFYGSKTSQQRYRHYSVQHNNEAPQEFGTNQQAAVSRLNQIKGNTTDEWAGFGKPENNINYQQPIQQSYPQAQVNPAPTRKVAKKQKSNYFTNEDTDYSLDASRVNYEYGGPIPIGKDGLQIEDDEYKMLSPRTAQIEGNTHENGGTDISFQGNEVEAEKGETVHIAEDGNAIVMGNMYVPGTKTKFKDAAKYIAKEEKKNSKVEKKGTNLLNKADPSNYYEGPSFNTGKVLQDSSIQKEVALTKEKEKLANTQQIMLQAADGLGKDPKEISRMGKGKSKYGISIPKAADGYRFDKDTIGADPSIAIPYMSDNSMYGITAKRNTSPSVEDNPVAIPYVGDNMMQYNIPKEYMEAINPISTSPIETMVPKEVNVDSPNINMSNDKVSNPRFKGYRNRLGASDFLAEIPEALDQVQPVSRQQFTPQLYSPYSVSFDDRVAANQGDFNAIQKTLKNNPAALAAVSGQKYQTDNQTRAEEFRTNQGIQNDVINKNTSLINQSNEMNIKLADEQMVRQAQAQENTKANRNAALASISSKIAANRSENAKNQMYADLYHYGYDPSKGFYHDDHYAAIMRDPSTNIDPLNPDEKTKTKKYTRNPKGQVEREVDNEQKHMGGMVGGISGATQAFRGIGGSDDSYYIKKKKKKYSKA